MGAEIDRRLGLMAQESMLPFAIIDRRDGPLNGRAVGMTTYMNIDAKNRRLEIGFTWYRRAVQRTPLNTECKFLLLSKAFEELDCIAVEFRTHAMNIQSRRGIERLGARLDGILRHHMIMPNGSLRDTAAYSIVAPDWPAVKANLTWMMEQIARLTAGSRGRTRPSPRSCWPFCCWLSFSRGSALRYSEPACPSGGPTR